MRDPCADLPVRWIPPENFGMVRAMPEGDTIARLAARLEQAMGGQTIRSLQWTDPRLAREDVVGRTFVSASAWGKNLLLHFSGGLSLHAHLRMRGRWFVESQPASRSLDRAGARVNGTWHPAQLRLCGQDVALLARLNHTLRWVETPHLRRLAARLGPNPLDDDFDVASVVAGFQREPELALGEALLRQDLVAGIGNVYKSELCFLEGIDPFLPLVALPYERLIDLMGRARRLMRRNLGPGPRVTRWISSGPRLWVYERAGQHCLRCGATLEMRRQGKHQRSTYFCPSCQSP